MKMMRQMVAECNQSHLYKASKKTGHHPSKSSCAALHSWLFPKDLVLRYFLMRNNGLEIRVSYF